LTVKQPGPAPVRGGAGVIGFKIKILARLERGGCIVIRQRPITQPKPLS
jgi:hypothetical protein